MRDQLELNSASGIETMRVIEHADGSCEIGVMKRYSGNPGSLGCFLAVIAYSIAENNADYGEGALTEIGDAFMVSIKHCMLKTAVKKSYLG
jgi:hypothetical protein